MAKKAAKIEETVPLPEGTPAFQHAWKLVGRFRRAFREAVKADMDLEGKHVNPDRAKRVREAWVLSDAASDELQQYLKENMNATDTSSEL